MKKSNVGQLDKVHAAITLGCTDQAEISELTGLAKESVASLLWHLRETDYDLERARKHRSAISMKSRSKHRNINSQSDRIPSVIKALEADGYKVPPQMITEALAHSYNRNVPQLGASANFEELGRSAFYLSDRALEAPTFS